MGAATVEQLKANLALAAGAEGGVGLPAEVLAEVEGAWTETLVGPPPYPGLGQWMPAAARL
eukprot:SAG22_NODE_5449_length_1012_cov_1.267251_2_plen_61_part_00